MVTVLLMIIRVIRKELDLREIFLLVLVLFWFLPH